MDGASVCDVRIRFSAPPGATLSTNISKHLHAIVSVNFVSEHFGVRTQSFGCVQTDRTLLKRMVKAVDPSFTRAILRRKAVAEAADRLLKRIRDAGVAAVQKTNQSELYGKALKKQRERDEAADKRARIAAVGIIRTTLANGASHLTLEELSEIWHQCQVELVMRF